jgi:hypothetical protein
VAVAKEKTEWMPLQNFTLDRHQFPGETDDCIGNSQDR